jgi:hypothetical protein
MILRNAIDYSQTTQWATEPWEQYCGYAQGIAVWDWHDRRGGTSHDATVRWNLVLGPQTAPPACHLSIGISLAAEGATAEHNIIDGQDGGLLYGLEMAHAGDLRARGNVIRSAETCVSTGVDPALVGGPRGGFRIEENEIGACADMGISIGGAVQGMEILRNRISGATRPIVAWEHHGAAPTGVEVIE